MAVYANGTTANGTQAGSYITGTVWADGSSQTVLGNPFVSGNGDISFYLDASLRVDLGITVPGFAAAYFPDVDVLSAAAAAGIALDGSAADIQPDGISGAGSTGKAADAGHIHPALSWQPADNGLLASNIDPATIGNGAAPAAGVLYLMKLPVRQALTISKLWFQVGGSGSGTSTGSFAGLYSPAGTLLTGSSDIGTILTAAPGVPSVVLTTPQALAAGSFAWAALLVNLSVAQPFLPQSYGANTAFLNVNLTPATAQFAKFGSGLTALPGSFTPSALTLPGLAWWVGAS